MMKREDFDTDMICFIDWKGMIVHYHFSISILTRNSRWRISIQNKICTVTCHVTIKFHVIYFYKAYFCLKEKCQVQTPMDCEEPAIPRV